MITQNFIIVCESASIDKDSNKLSLFGIFTNISAKNIPAIHPTLFVVTNFSGGEGEHTHKIIISYEGSEEIGKLEGKIVFGPDGGNAQYLGRFIGLPFPKYGIYYISVYVDGKEQPLRARINFKQT